MALVAGLYFRRAARNPSPDEARYVEISEGLYHYGVAVAGWCAALLIPWLRQPSTALIALALPAVYFWIRAELGLRAQTEEGPRYRNSAAVLGFVVLGLYALRPVFQMVLFPETSIHTDHYHHNAVFVMALGLLLMRLHALGGTEWLAFYGGLALMGGSYFALTAWPGLSPFEDPCPPPGARSRSRTSGRWPATGALRCARCCRSWPGSTTRPGTACASPGDAACWPPRSSPCSSASSTIRPTPAWSRPCSWAPPASWCTRACSWAALVPGRRPGRDRARAARRLLRAELSRPADDVVWVLLVAWGGLLLARRALRPLRRRRRDRGRPASPSS